MDMNETARLDEPRLEQRLAGRARWVIACCAAGALLGAVIGYRAVSPVYRAEARLTLTPALPAAPGEGATRFEAFVGRQVADIERRAILEPAMYRSGYKAGDYADFARCAAARRDGDAIAVSFEHTDPAVAAAAAGAIADVYLDRAPRADLAAVRRTHAALRRDAQQFAEACDAIGRRHAEAGGAAQIEALHQRHEYLLARMGNIEQDLEQVQTVLIEAGAGQAAALQPSSADPRRDEMIARRKTLAAEADALASRLGDQHPALRQHRAELAQVERWLIDHPAPAAAATVTFDIPDPAHNLAAVRQRKAALLKLRDATKVDIDEVVAQAAALIKLDQAHEALQRKARDADAAQRAFAAAQAFAGRAALAGAIDRPVTAARDGRASAASFAAAVGALAGFLAVLLMGPAPAPLRRAADLADELPLLGALPTMTDQLDDADAATAAALCVHNLRNRMQLAAAPSGAAGAHAFAVTSASAEAGKTSVTIALGLSLAASGSRTLLIDAAFAGRGLTERAEALGVAEATGLLAALDGTDAAAAAVATAVPGLSILGLDDAIASDAHRLSAGALRRILDQTRQSFDVILIDTPTAVGRVETPVIAAAADAVLTVVTRGEDLHQVRATLTALSRLGATVAGLIFNHAPRHDVDNLTANRRAA